MTFIALDAAQAGLNNPCRFLGRLTAGGVVAIMGMSDSMKEFLVGTPRSSWLKAARFLPLAAMMAFIFFMSSRAVPPGRAVVTHVGGRVFGSDSFLHFLCYLVLGATAIWAIRPSVRTAWWAIALGWVLASVYGASDEFHQHFVPGRSASLRDLMLDSFGAAVPALVWGAIVALRSWVRGTRPAGQARGNS